MTTQVRRAAFEDAAAIAQIHVRTWQVAYRGLLPDELLEGLDVQQRTSMWRKILGATASSTAVFVAERGAEVAGFCAIAESSRDQDADGLVGEVGAIYVEPRLWRRGVGQALMDAALRQLRDQGRTQVTLWVLPENESARGFYARSGFEPDGAERIDDSTGQMEVRLRAPL